MDFQSQPQTYVNASPADQALARRIELDLNLLSALGGHLEALRLLIPMARQLPVLDQIRVSEILFVHLGDPEIVPNETSSTDPTVQNNIELAHTCLLSLCYLVEIIPKDIHYIARIKRAWPGIFKWSQFFFDVYINRRHQERDATLLGIKASWNFFVETFGMQDLIIATPGSIELATNLWIAGDGWSEKASRYQGNPYAVLSNLLREKTYPQVRGRILSVVKGKPMILAKLLISRLQALTKSKTGIEERLDAGLDLLMHFTQFYKHEIIYALLEAGIIPCLVNFLDTAATMALLGKAGVDDITIRNVSMALISLMFCVGATDGWRWILQAVKSGFLSVVLTLSPNYERLHHGSYHAVADIIGDLLPRYMVYYSVMIEVKKQLDNLDDSVIWTTGFGEAWKRMRNKCLALWLISQSPELKLEIHCSNRLCTKSGHPEQFRKCATCLMAYCSKECQILHLKNGHKEACKDYIHGPNDVPVLSSMTELDRTFLRQLMWFDVWHHRQELQKIAVDAFSNVPLRDFVIQADYTPISRTLRIMPVAKTIEEKVTGPNHAFFRSYQTVLANTREKNLTSVIGLFCQGEYHSPLHVEKEFWVVANNSTKATKDVLTALALLNGASDLPQL
ncbi:hypothetical protein M422DRAFT_778640 [Sphaerobolus stellatus SS14]|uniref:MYND-type domain-containing protein n=1 Tax=Sphaerobolus stellatus (strain SS14) TaxID=990650 RepID=A0A0C9USP1_SPHS4|nr:hypothetical protein M422DRAFT_778640 [Sphaerobolus stellatus SS14]